MRIDELLIHDFKNLQDFHIDFDERELISVIVGRNGTGKSNIIEALVIIFRDLDLKNDPQFAYKLRYQISQFEVVIDADPTRFRAGKRRTKDFYHIDVTDIKTDKTSSLSLTRFSDDEERRFLPRYVFGYYSGPSNRLEQHFEAHQDRFYKELIGQQDDDDVPPLRPLLYARLIHSQFALLAFFLERDPAITQFLADQLRIVGFDSVLFILKTPNWAKRKDQREHRFWTARGTVRVFMERLYELSLAPFKLSVSRTEDYLYLYIKDRNTLQELAWTYFAEEDFERQETSFQSFFKALESTYISDLIHEVRIKVQIKNVDDSLTFRELSEGEQQLLMVLGLMRFTNEDESLFLLDEPDTHLNPAWSIDYLPYIQGSENIVGLRENSQVIMTTHSPMTLAGLKASQVKIVHRKDSDGKVYSASAENDPKGMGFAGILTSDLFGLRSTLDPETLAKLDRQRELLIKQIDDTLTEDEKAELNRLNQELEDIDATRYVRDHHYPLFVNKMTRYEIEQGTFKARQLSLDEMQERNEIALDIIEELFDEEDAS